MEDGDGEGVVHEEHADVVAVVCALEGMERSARRMGHHKFEQLHTGPRAFSACLPVFVRVCARVLACPCARVRVCLCVVRGSSWTPHPLHSGSDKDRAVVV